MVDSPPPGKFWVCIICGSLMGKNHFDSCKMQGRVTWRDPCVAVYPIDVKKESN